LTTKALPSTDAFANLATAYAVLTRELSASLVEQHGLTINDYGCLLRLSRAGDQGMRRIDLANELQLSPSGITRLLDRLEDQGLVGKGECKEDARVSYAILTEQGLNKLREAAPGHV
jgi:MarR family transcriptional regulator, 2-MHQ and catechol-resistance regulon repressor